MRIFITAISKSGKPTLASRVAAEAECRLVINLGDVQVVYLEDSYVSVICSDRSIGTQQESAVLLHPPPASLPQP